MKTIKKKINDAQYYSPNAINGCAGKLLRYGRYHDKEVEFSINKSEYGESIFCKTPNWKKFKAISFCWLIGSFDQNGIQKVGTSILYAGTEFLFSFYLHELVDLLKQLESTRELRIWQSQLEKTTTE